MAPAVDAIGCLSPGSQNTQSTLVPCDDPQGNAHCAFRSRSDSLDIFTMSPLGTPPFDSYSDAQVGPSAPQLRLPDPPALDLDLGLSESGHQLTTIPIPYYSRSPPSTPNSPTSFSFSPPKRTNRQYRSGSVSTPFELNEHSPIGGASYDTDITSIVGSWDDKQQIQSQDHVVPIQADKGKSTEQEISSYFPSPPESSSSKGKEKAVDQSSILSSPPHTSFEFNHDFPHVHDLNVELKSSSSHEDGGVVEGVPDLPVVRLSPGSQYRQFGEDNAGAYAGPSSRNGHVRALSTEDVLVSPDPGSSQDTQASSTSSSPPISPLPPSALSLFRPATETSSPSRLPAHRHSLSSLSLRSIRSSSSRSIASIRSSFTGAGIRGKVR